jgi:hypothetical protein
MKKKVILILIFLLFWSILLTGCDPEYPPGTLKVVEPGTLSAGSSVDIEIIYPYSGGSYVLGWKDQNIEIIKGEDIIAVSGLTITGIKKGNAQIKVNVTTVLSDVAYQTGYEDRIYSIKLKITVN